MRNQPHKKAEKYRITKGPMASDKSYGNNGAFEILGPYKATLFVIASDGAEWRSIKGYENLYEVSNKGGVRALSKTRIMNGIEKHYKMRILLPSVNWAGYERIPLYKNEERKQTLVHKLVADAFIPNPHNYPVINHRNGKKGNNHVLNLEWCTREYNEHHAIENGLRGGFKAEDIKKIKVMFNEGMAITQIANKYEKSESTISDYIFERHRNLEPEKPSRYEGMPLWDHVSISCIGRTPTWKETCFIKDLFWNLDETVIQYHPPEANYINVHPFVLHLWRPQNIEIPWPPLEFV